MTEPQQVVAELPEGLRQARAALGGLPPHVPELDDDLDTETLAEERDRELARQRSARWSMVCPQRFHSAELADLDASVRADLETWEKSSPRTNLGLVGPVGVGKTHAALASVKRDWLERGLGVTFLPVTEALDLLRPGGEPGALERLVDVERLVLDDVGSERVTDWTAERLYVLINRRWMEERPIIWTSNLEVGPEGSLIETLGPRTYSRLVGSDALVVRMTGNDRRRQR